MKNLAKIDMSPKFKADPRNLHWVVRDDVQGYAALAQRLKALIGVDMPPTEKNRVLMACRLAPLMRRAACGSYAEYDRLLSRSNPDQLRDFIGALTTHTTDFFRESRHFDFFAEILPKIAASRRRETRPELRVWCSAASSGQEAYTMLFSLYETYPALRSWDLKFLATDIDRVPLLKAVSGRYTDQEMRKVPQSIRSRYFEPRRAKGSQEHVVREVYRKLITFAEFNLAKVPYPFQHPFDIIFCRNVLIYFDHFNGAEVVDRLVAALRPGGYLFVGHSETGFIHSRFLTPVAPSVFQKGGK